MIGGAATLNSYADDNWNTSMFSLRGFGTLGAVHSSNDQSDFVGIVTQPTGAGYSHQWAWGVDSKIGAQVDAHFNTNFSGVVQLVAQHRYNDTYTPQVEWANLKYQVTPDFSIRAGRFVAAPFMLSDARLVGYAYPWVRPPIEVYGALPVTNKDGIDATYNAYFGEVKNSIQTSYGRTSLKVKGDGNFSGTGNFTVDRFFNLSDTVEVGAATFRFAYDSHRITFHIPLIDSLFDGLNQFGNAVIAIPGLQATGAQALALHDQYQIVNSPFSNFTVGGTYDPGDWYLMGEWVKAKNSAAFASATAWYVSGGYRFDTVTPYVTVARLKAQTLTVPGIPTAGLPPPLVAAANGLNAGMQAAVQVFNNSQKTVSTGVRWDFMKNVDLKLQYDRIKIDPGSTGRFGNVQPGFQTGAPVNLLSVTIDFVF